MKRGRSVVDTLASPFFSGRGYVNSGDSLAAEFLAKEFQHVGLKPFADSYFQKFEMSVNTFPSEMLVKVNGKPLQAGRDYILDPASVGTKGLFRLLPLDSQVFVNPNFIFPSKKRKTALYYPAEWEKRISKLPLEVQKQLQEFSVLVRIVPKKLTFSVARQVDKQCTIEILADKFPTKIKKIRLNIENKFIHKHLARNVIGILEGSKKDSFLLITAHYDHLGRMGRETYFPGANDNASGIAMLLELARFYSLPENRLPYSLMFVGFAAEEAGLVGSKFYVNNPLFPLAKIKFMLNLDLMGSGKEGVTVVNGAVFNKEFQLLDSLNKANNWLPLVKPRGKAANSDHYFFSEKGVPAFFMYTNGEITAYHDVDDTPSVVTFSKFKEVFALITAFFKGI